MGCATVNEEIFTAAQHGSCFSVFYPDWFAIKADVIDQPLHNHLMLTDVKNFKTFFNTDNGAFWGAGKAFVQQVL